MIPRLLEKLGTPLYNLPKILRPSYSFVGGTATFLYIFKYLQDTGNEELIKKLRDYFKHDLDVLVRKNIECILKKVGGNVEERMIKTDNGEIIKYFIVTNDGEIDIFFPGTMPNGFNLEMKIKRLKINGKVYPVLDLPDLIAMKLIVRENRPWKSPIYNSLREKDIADLINLICLWHYFGYSDKDIGRVVKKTGFKGYVGLLVLEDILKSGKDISGVIFSRKEAIRRLEEFIEKYECILDKIYNRRRILSRFYVPFKKQEIPQGYVIVKPAEGAPIKAVEYLNKIAVEKNGNYFFIPIEELKRIRKKYGKHVYIVLNRFMTLSNGDVNKIRNYGLYPSLAVYEMKEHGKSFFAIDFIEDFIRKLIENNVEFRVSRIRNGSSIYKNHVIKIDPLEFEKVYEMYHGVPWDGKGYPLIGFVYSDGLKAVMHLPWIKEGLEKGNLYKITVEIPLEKVVVLGEYVRNPWDKMIAIVGTNSAGTPEAVSLWTWIPPRYISKIEKIS